MSNRLLLSVPNTVVNTYYYSPNAEWVLDTDSFEYTIADRFMMSEVRYKFKMKRLAAFYLLTLFIPFIGIGALTCLVFILPSESGTDISTCFTFKSFSEQSVFMYFINKMVLSVQVQNSKKIIAMTKG